MAKNEADTKYSVQEILNNIYDPDAQTIDTGATVTVDSITLSAGTNNIGDVDVASLTPGTYAVDDSAMPATPQTVPVSGEYRSGATTYTDGDVTVLQTDVNGNLKVTQATAQAATTDSITAKLATDTIQNGTTALTPKFKIIDCATSGDNTILAAVTAKKIRVHALYLVAAGTTTVRFEDGAGGTALSGQMSLVANTGFVLPFNPVGWFETTAATLLNLELSAAISVDGGFQYTEV